MARKIYPYSGHPPIPGDPANLTKEQLHKIVVRRKRRDRIAKRLEANRA